MTGSTSSPVQVGGLVNVVQAAAGQAHTLALLQDGTVWAWGYNGNGELGNGTVTSSPVPVQVAGLSGVTAIAAGYNDSLALRNDGTVWAWGANFHGQLGNGTFGNNPTPTPVQVGGLSGVVSVSADFGYRGASPVAGRNDGTVWAWGYYTFNNQINVLSPIQVTGLIGIKSISTSNGHTLALANDGTVWAWGTNDLDQLGDGTFNYAPLPIQVNGLGGVTAIATGHGDSVALRNDGSVWEWGWQFTSSGTTPVIISDNPVQVPGLPPVTAISEGELHTLAVGGDGSVWAWGDNFYHELGNGTNVGNWTPNQVTGLSGITDVSAGYDDSFAIHGAPAPSPSPSISSSSPSPTPTPGKLRIAALGDSVASGEGTRYRWSYVLDSTRNNGRNGVWNGQWVEGNARPTWEPTNDNTPAAQDCHRSTDGYPYKVAASLNATLWDVACSGATAGNGILRRQAFADGNVAATPQLGINQQLYDPPNTAYDSQKPDIVTLTLGANDVDFADVVTACYKSAISGITHSRFCDTDKALNAKVNALLAQQKTNLDKVLTELVSRGRAAGKVPLIVLTTYYDPFPKPGTVCRDIKPAASGSIGLSAGEVRWIEGKRLQLNLNIWSVAKLHPEVKVVDLENALAEHQWCSKDPWVYGPSIDAQPHQSDNPSPFHPTPQAQTVIANRVATAIRARLNL